MNWDRVRQLLDLDDELETDGRLRMVVKDEELYKLDYRRWLVAVIERMFDAEGALAVFSVDED
jgi:hypothetical protein